MLTCSAYHDKIYISTINGMTMLDNDESPRTAKRNLYGQGVKVLQDIVNAYETGVLDDPKSSILFCSLLACICEGKVRGHVDEDTGMVKWSLTERYAKEMEELQKSLVSAAQNQHNVVQGPWQ